MTSIAVIGAGVVGSSWALVFARAGLDVVVHDPDPAAAGRVAAFAAANAGADGDGVLSRIRTAPSLEEALAGADYVQESAPERLEIKKALYRRLDAAAGPDTILASSTSGLPASAFTEGLAGNRRCLVVHPINPPHLVPLVEIVPAPWTAPEVVERAGAVMRSVGQSPIELRREIAGFVVNRLQSALLGEAFRLVEDGICSADEVDRAVSDGLGLRWFFMGPFQTIDLNAANGIAEYCRNLGPMYFDLAREQADPRPWSPALVAEIERQLRGTVSEEALPERRAWRDRYLAALKAVKAAPHD
ncbi:3-hydroxyacyl-CoA dehydrogenase [Labrys monachus]|uniref:L-gulonate 3-dehydrogenase n=1 Tax=Labrys monachus TaxID=217067 RepID=A0ABU0FNB0_9HYPH|nr:3-hydroxyacyl-CoA dehydrogenase [Labrys monachus]MDQ0396006.1 3-hydroxyacyl-CoA dehydrogenase [Labrys monachus]